MSDVSAEEQKRVAARVLSECGPMAPGDVWFVVSARWWGLFKSYARLDERVQPSPDAPNDADKKKEAPARPGEIDNNDIVVAPTTDGRPAAVSALGDEKGFFGARLRPGLQCNFDYVLVPQKLWQSLFAWYCGGPAIRRYVIEEGVHKQTRVEVYPLCVLVAGAPGTATAREDELVVSKHATAALLMARACEHWGFDVLKARLWLSGRVLESTVTLDQLCVSDGQKFTVELKTDGGQWPKMPPQGHAAPARRGIMRGVWGAVKSFLLIGEDDDGIEEEAACEPGTHQRGLCGLHNMGNTCFMNSALQCLSNSAPLTDYFTSDRFKKDINSHNPMGMKGQLAEAYGHLLKAMWSGCHTAVAPRTLKYTVGKWAPQFSGYAQHDSQELLSFLLDGLHEDLNEVSKKPFVEIPEGGNGKPDEEVAEEAWHCHLRRNRSIIVNLFQGQLKSTLVCPDCRKTSVIFDPVMYLSLPIPTERERIVHLVFYQYTKDLEELPTKYAFKMQKRGAIGDLKVALSQEIGLRVEEMSFASVYNAKIYSFSNSETSLNSIHDNDLNVIYEVPSEAQDDAFVRLHFVHRRVHPGAVGDSGGLFSRSPYDIFGVPMILFINSQTTCTDLYVETWRRIKRYIKDLASEPPFSCADTDSAPPGSAQAESSEVPSDGEKEKEEKDKSKEKVKDKDKDKDKDQGKESKEGKESKKRHRKHKTHKHRHSKDHRHPGSQEAESSGTESRSHSHTPSPNPSRDSGASEPQRLPQHPGHTVFRVGEKWQEVPFKLSLVSSTGLTCSRCPWNSDCWGCNVPPGLETLKVSAEKDKNMTHTIGIDWCGECLRKSGKVVDAVNSVRISSQLEEIRKEQTTRRITIDDCVRMFTANERLGPDDPWYCPRCKDHKQADKKFDLWRMPELLVVHLKRFQYSRMFREKLTTNVEFSSDYWDLSPFVPPQKVPPVYRLYAISNHIGGLGGGHYTAYARNRDNGKWYSFNDSSCHQVNESEIHSGAAYLLFFQRIQGSGTPPPLLPPVVSSVSVSDDASQTPTPSVDDQQAQKAPPSSSGDEVDEKQKGKNM